MRISLALHIVGLVFWLGGILFLTLLLRSFADQQLKSEKLPALAKKLYFRFILAGVLVSVVTGLYQLGVGGLAAYFQQGWFHTKLTLVLVLLAVTGLLSFEVRNFSAGKVLSSGKIMAFHGVSSLCLVVIVFLTLLGRG